MERGLLRPLCLIMEGGVETGSNIDDAINVWPLIAGLSNSNCRCQHSLYMCCSMCLNASLI